MTWKIFISNKITNLYGYINSKDIKLFNYSLEKNK